jgi:hypothetical protein
MDTTAWKINESECSENATLHEKLKFLLRYAILAPSGHNTEPCKFAVDNDGIKVFADINHALPVADPDSRELYISIGRAIENPIVAARHLGYTTDIEYFHSGFASECVAAVGFQNQRIALAATSIGIMQHPMNQGLIEIPARREKLGEILGVNETPQFAFRLWYAMPAKHQVRKALEEVVANGGKHGK